jgi:hypothetical protein
MTFPKLTALEIIYSITGTVVVTVLIEAGMRPLWLLILIPILIFVVGYSSFKHRFQVLRSGVVSYYKSFPLALGPKKWAGSQSEIVYWGVTGGSILEDIRSLLKNENGRHRHYRFLLMSSSGIALREQVAFKKGYNYTDLSSEQITIIDQECDVEKQRLAACIAVLKSSSAYRDSPPRLEIREFNEFISWWIYLIDQKEMIVGVLRSGQEVGEQPAAILRKSFDHTNLFTALHENLERVWRSAKVL